MHIFGVSWLRYAATAGVLALALLLALVEFWPGSGRQTSDSAAATIADGPMPAGASPSQRFASPDRAIERKAMGPVRTEIVAAGGDTLFDILLRAGAGRDDATAALAALHRIYDPRTLKVGQRVDVELGPPAAGTAPRLLTTVGLAPEPGRRITISHGATGFAASANSLPEVREFAHFAGTIKSSLFESAMAQGVPPQVLANMIAAFSYDVDFQRDLQPGDAFELMYQRTRDSQGEIIHTGDIVYADLTLSGKHLAVYRYVDASRQVDFYNSKGESVRKALLRTPVDGARITSKFGMRVNPILGFSMMHKGVDFGVPTGTPIMAAGSGAIEKAGENGAYGLYIRVKHDGVHSTAYAHLSALAKGIHAGTKVKQGQVIGFVGESGRATGPHLHYEVLVNNQQVNPMSVKFKSGNVLAGRELARFKSVIAEAETRLAETPVSTQLALAHRAAE